MTRLKLPRQILTLHKTAQRGKFILQKRVSMLNAKILSTSLCSLFVLSPPTPPPKYTIKKFFVLGPSISLRHK